MQKYVKGKKKLIVVIVWLEELNSQHVYHEHQNFLR